MFRFLRMLARCDDGNESKLAGGEAGVALLVCLACVKIRIMGIDTTWGRCVNRGECTELGNYTVPTALLEIEPKVPVPTALLEIEPTTPTSPLQLPVPPINPLLAVVVEHPVDRRVLHEVVYHAVRLVALVDQLEVLGVELLDVRQV